MHENLTQLGLTEKEATVYLVLLRNGPALASTLALRTQLRRVTIYGVLDSLAVRGLVSFENTQEGRRYLPHDPECLLYLLEQEKAALQMKWDLTKNCIQSLSQNNSQHIDARQVLFFKGWEGTQEALRNFFDPKQELSGLVAERLSLSEKDFLAQLQKSPKKYAKKIKWIQSSASPPGKAGTLLVQGSKVFFLCERKELELMLIRNAEYAETVFKFLIEPHLRTQECSPIAPPSLF